MFRSEEGGEGEGETDKSDAFKTKKEGDSVHSTFSTKKKWKRVGGLCHQ